MQSAGEKALAAQCFDGLDEQPFDFLLVIRAVGGATAEAVDTDAATDADEVGPCLDGRLHGHHGNAVGASRVVQAHGCGIMTFFPVGQVSNLSARQGQVNNLSHTNSTGVVEVHVGLLY